MRATTAPLERLTYRRRSNGCWVPTLRPNSQGYVCVRLGRRGEGYVLGHRLMYETHVGPIPAGMQLDHTCHTRALRCHGGVTCKHQACVNPAHMEAVTAKENVGRGRRWH